MLQNGQRFVQLLQHADDGVALLDVVHRLLHGHLSVEATSKINKKQIKLSKEILK
jgi:hypothetical protein